MLQGSRQVSNLLLNCIKWLNIEIIQVCANLLDVQGAGGSNPSGSTIMT